MTVIAEKAQSALSRMGIDFDAVYNAHVPLMIGIAVDRFHIEQSDAQTLAHAALSPVAVLLTREVMWEE